MPNTNGDSAGDSYTYTAVAVGQPVYTNNAWVVASTVGDGQAQWISWDASTGIPYEGDASNPSITNDGTSYVYTDTFTISGAAPNAMLKLNALLAADNIITGVSLEDTTSSVDVPLTITYNTIPPNDASSTNYYHVASSISASAANLFQSSSSQTFTLTVDVVNWDTNAFDAPESTGFILDGTADVPEPVSMLVCAVAAAGTLFRRRR